MKKSRKKALTIIVVLVLVVALCAVIFRSGKGTTDYSSKYEGVDLSVDIEGLDRNGTYAEYLAKHADAGFPSEEIDVDLLNYQAKGDAEVYKDFEGESKALFTGDGSQVTWNVKVPEAGFYRVYLEYMTVESRGVEIERSVIINGESPFTNAANITFSRLWKDGGDVRTDNQGNQIRPIQVEDYKWQTAYCKDDMGYVTEPYQFYFKKGDNELTFDAVNEPMVLRKLTLKPVVDTVTYEEYSRNNTGSTTDLSKFIEKIQGEDSTLRSDSSLYAKYDRSSPTTEPGSVTKTLLNYTGGDAWSKSGQWIEWDFEVPSDGYYNITIKGRQNYARGSVSCRSLYIDGEIPFEEVKAVAFDYSNDWNVMTLSDEEGTPYKFYLKEGKHTIRLEATLGNIGPILQEMEDSSFRLNQIYRKILVYTGPNPDVNRDYHVEKIYPEVMDGMEIEAKRLYKIIDDVVKYTGQKAEKIATAQTLAQELELFLRRPDKITTNFGTFKNNITSLGTSILNMSETKLDIDYIVVTGDGGTVPEDKASGWDKFAHEIKSFAASFVVDYDAVGDVYAGKDAVKVWIVTGRDQGTILKSMIDDTFIPQTGIPVNLEIVDGGALLNAVVAGRGPDVVLSVGADQPVNYALRNAVEDLTQFEGYEEVLEDFYPSAYRQYEYNGGLYALPETQTYNVMFYRKDVMEEMGLEVPNTWDDLIGLLPTIQGDNLSVGLPSPTSATAPDLSLFYTLLYQMGGEVYDEDGRTTIVDEEEGVNAFKMYTSFYNDYGVPMEFDFVNRFRSGEMPIGIANYSLYNTLQVSAPEIRGLWDFTLVPGTVRTDESGKEYIDRSTYSTGGCTMMIRSKDEKKKQNAWEFMKWWVSADAQVRFGREMEALLGSSARYATANRKAFDQLAWSADNVKALEQQWGYTVGFREVAGGYYTGRHIVNAVRKVINKKEDPRETILEYSITIDEELHKKRVEFGLEKD